MNNNQADNLFASKQASRSAWLDLESFCDVRSDPRVFQ